MIGWVRLLAAYFIAISLLITPVAAQRQAQQPTSRVKVLSACPDWGNATGKTSPDGLMNIRKWTFPTGTTPIILTLDDFQGLQDQATRLLHKNRNLSASDRALLQHLPLKSSVGHVSEGDSVQASGYMVQMPAHPKAEGPEAVNCNPPADLTHRNVDFHIPLAPPNMRQLLLK